MKTLSLIPLFLLFLTIRISSQSCLSEGITFSTQAQVDSFQINYPGCTQISGPVLISGAIDNLNGLHTLTSVGSYLAVRHNDALSSLSGLNKLTSVGGNLVISWNAMLTSLSGLDNLVSIGGGLEICGNAGLTSLSGLDNLDSIGGDLELCGNAELTSLSGLDDLPSIGGKLYIRDDAMPKAPSGLDSISSGNKNSLEKRKKYKAWVIKKDHTKYSQLGLYQVMNEQLVLSSIDSWEETPYKNMKKVVIPLSEVQSIKLRNKTSPATGFWGGLLIGAVTGVVSGYISGDEEVIAPACYLNPFLIILTPDECTKVRKAGTKAITRGLGYGVVGGITGLIIGSTARIKIDLSKKEKSLEELKKRAFFQE